MTASEVSKVPGSLTARARAVHALALKGMTPSLLAAQPKLLALVDEAPRPTRPLRDTQRAKILWSAFEKTAASARAAVLSIKDIKNVTPTEREASWIAAAGELLGLTDEASFIRKLRAGRKVFCAGQGRCLGCGRNYRLPACGDALDWSGWGPVVGLCHSR